MAVLDELIVRLKADNGDFITKFRDAKESVSSLDTAFKALKTGLATLGVGKLLTDAVNAAGELEQSIGGSEAVFKQWASTVQASAKKAASSLGLAESEYLATATKMGALFQGSGFSVEKSADMTTKAMQRAADVASIMGISVSDAMNAIAGAAKGNFTMMDNLGVAMNDTALQAYAAEKGLGKLETTQQKVNAAMQMFIEKTEYAAGNYAKENDTYAGSLNTLKAEFGNFMAEFGTQLRPVAMEVLSLGRVMLSTLGPVIVELAQEYIPVLAEGFQSMLPTVENLVGGIVTVGKAFNSLSPEMKNIIVWTIVGTTALRAMTTAFGGVGAAALIVGGLFLAMVGGIKNAAKDTAEAAESTFDGAENAVEDTTKSVDGLNAGLGETKKALSGLAGFDEITKLSGGSSKGVFSGYAEGAQDAADEAQKAIESAMKSAEAMQDTLDELNVPSLNWNSLKEGLGDTWSNVKKLFSGNSDDIYQGLKGLDADIRKLFGDEWSDFWAGVGSNMFDVMFADRDVAYNAAKGLYEDLKNIPFGEIIADNMVGFQAIAAYLSGDIAKGDALASVVASSTLGKIGASQYDNSNSGAQSYVSSKSDAISLRNDIIQAFNENIRRGWDTDAAWESVKTEFRLRSSDLKYAGDNGQEFDLRWVMDDNEWRNTAQDFFDNGGFFSEAWLEDQAEKVRASLVPTYEPPSTYSVAGATPSYSGLSAPVTSSDIYAAVTSAQRANGFGNYDSGYVHADFSVDGDVIYSGYAPYTVEQTTRTGGLS